MSYMGHFLYASSDLGNVLLGTGILNQPVGQKWTWKGSTSTVLLLTTVCSYLQGLSKRSNEGVVCLMSLPDRISVLRRICWKIFWFALCSLLWTDMPKANSQGKALFWWLNSTAHCLSHRDSVYYIFSLLFPFRLEKSLILANCLPFWFTVYFLKISKLICSNGAPLAALK